MVTHDVKSCYDYCEESTLFALSSDACFCFLDNSRLSELVKCYPQRCSGSKADFCGDSSIIAVVYQAVSEQHQGLGECLASGYIGEYNLTGAQYYQFGRPIVLPCADDDIGYMYRTVLGFPHSHHLQIYTLPVQSWPDAVEQSYQTAEGILEFQSFLIPKQSLLTPMADDKYWVGLFRRHQMTFGTDLPSSSSTHCVAGRLDTNGKLSTEFRPCADYLRVLCQYNDVTSSHVTEMTLIVRQKISTIATNQSSGFTRNNNSSGAGDGFADHFKWYIVLAVLSALLLLVIVITVVCCSLKIKRRKAINIPESTPNNYTDFRVMLESNEHCGMTNSSGEELYLTVSEQELATDTMVDRPRLSLPPRKCFIGNVLELNGTEASTDDEHKELESAYSDIKDELEIYDETSLVELKGTSRSAGTVAPDGQYFVLEKVYPTDTPSRSFKHRDSKENESVQTDRQGGTGDMYYKVEKSDTGVVFYHELERRKSDDIASSNLTDVEKHDVSNNIVVYHKLEKPSKSPPDDSLSKSPPDDSLSMSRKRTKKEVSFPQKTGTSLEPKNSYEKLWKDDGSTNKAKSVKIKWSQESKQPHARVNVSASAPSVNSARRNKGSTQTRGTDPKGKGTGNRVRVSALPDVSSPTSDPVYDTMNNPHANSPSTVCDEEYDTMESVRAYLGQPQPSVKL
ncbi:uncharacterized protein LOC125670512 [Ostrea edulis]|uniref:uncharacterized protein LOC125670512 n=1 Tax=Ostrea edulis TaxID=37623 RepID=UPI0024AECC9A|nr:uncharacterized protein LOC125670512 [Ostrea edulis]